jgi:DNA repair exonuclease SbcCD ATPase subunit
LYPPYFPYIQTPIRTPDVSSEREIKTYPEDVQNIVKKMINDYSRSNEFKTNVRNVMKEEFSFLETEGIKTNLENDGDGEIPLGKQLQNYLDVKIEERMKKYDESFKRIEEKLSKLLEQKQPTVESETQKLNDLAKQLDELKKRLDEITNLLPRVSSPQASGQQPQIEENVSLPSQRSITNHDRLPQTPQLTEEQLERLVSMYEVSPEVFEEMPKKGLEEFGEKLLRAAKYSAEGIIDIGELIKYERSKNKDPRVYLPLIEVARKSDYLHEPSPDGKSLIPKVPLLPFEEILWREWSRKYIEKYGCYTGPLEEAYRFMHHMEKNYVS